MSANIFGERFAGRDVAWHRIGKILDKDIPSAVDAIRQAEMDYEIVKVPVTFDWMGEPQEMKDRSVLVREPTTDDPSPQSLAVVSNRYHVVQNMDIAQILDELGLPGKWPVETVGALGKGGTMFITLKAGGYDLNGDPDEALEQYFIVTDQRDGKTTLKIAYTPIRVVCQNTLVQGLSAATNLTNVFHRGGMRGEIKDRVSIAAGLERIQHDTLAMFERMAKEPLTGKRASVAISRAYPDPSRPGKLDIAESFMDGDADGFTDFAGAGVGWDGQALGDIAHKWTRESARINTLRRGAFERYQTFNEEHPQYAETQWAVYNAVVEHEDFRDGPKSMYSSSLWGSRAKAKVRVLDYFGGK